MENTDSTSLSRSTNVVQENVPQTIEHSAEISIRKRGPISERDYSLPKKRRGGRSGTLTNTQLESFRQARKEGVCLRCRFSRSKVRLVLFPKNQTNEIQCYGGFPCIPCKQRRNPTLNITPCTKAEFFDIIMARSYSSCTDTCITEL